MKLSENINRINELIQKLNEAPETKKSTTAETLGKNLISKKFQLASDLSKTEYTVYFKGVESDESKGIKASNIFVIIPSNGDYRNCSIWWSGVDGAGRFFDSFSTQYTPLWTKKITIMCGFSDEVNGVLQVLPTIGNPKVSSVIGYSMGGSKVWSLVGKYPFVGLMDPFTTANDYSYASAAKGKNVALYYTQDFWNHDFGGMVTNAKHLQQCAKLMGVVGKRGAMGASYFPTLKHWDTPKVFVPDFMSYF